eukprot:Awhi_evm1s3708
MNLSQNHPIFGHFLRFCKETNGTTPSKKIKKEKEGFCATLSDLTGVDALDTLCQNVYRGVPVICSATNIIYDLAPEFQEKLIVAEDDSPDKIREALVDVFFDYEDKAIKTKALHPLVKLKAKREWKKFVEDLDDIALPPVPPLSAFIHSY